MQLVGELSSLWNVLLAHILNSSSFFTCEVCFLSSHILGLGSDRPKGRTHQLLYSSPATHPPTLPRSVVNPHWRMCQRTGTHTLTWHSSMLLHTLFHSCISTLSHSTPFVSVSPPRFSHHLAQLQNVTILSSLPPPFPASPPQLLIVTIPSLPLSLRHHPQLPIGTIPSLSPLCHHSQLTMWSWITCTRSTPPNLEYRSWISLSEVYRLRPNTPSTLLGSGFHWGRGELWQ